MVNVWGGERLGGERLTIDDKIVDLVLGIFNDLRQSSKGTICYSITGVDVVGHHDGRSNLESQLVDKPCNDREAIHRLI